jgi:hypothetical protein
MKKTFRFDDENYINDMNNKLDMYDKNINNVINKIINLKKNITVVDNTISQVNNKIISSNNVDNILQLQSQVNDLKKVKDLYKLQLKENERLIDSFTSKDPAVLLNKINKLIKSTNK